jgi:hypothetical protein
MNGEIKKETGDGFGLLVVDNNGVEHKIGVCYDGEIDGHLQDGYENDPAQRTKEQSEHLNQVRRFAKWHVYRERGYDTLAPYDNPDRILAAIRAVLDLTAVEVQHYFGELREMIHRHHEHGEMDLPFEDADPDDIIVYRKDIWLQPDPTDAEPPLLDQFCEYVNDPLATLDDIFGDGPDPRDALPDYEIEAVSDIHYLHSDGLSKQEHWSDQPLDREPDARLELMPVDAGAFDSFETFLASHLVNQVRDCFIEMGVEPPEPFQVQGLGKHDSMVKQQLMRLYEPYFQASEPVRSWDSNSE